MNKVAIVITVYENYENFRDCINSVLKHTTINEDTVLIIVNDASTDVRVLELLEVLRSNKFVKIINNEKNLGHTKSANIGMKVAGDCDVVLLNSDTIVSPFWLEGLKKDAYSSERVASVLAMTDNAGAFSFPIPYKRNPKPEHVSYDEFALSVVSATYNLKPVEVPVACGFCLYIKREALNKVGFFDEEEFEECYGEDTDFSLRAWKLGYTHLISTKSFVFHKQRPSSLDVKYGFKKWDLVRRGIRKLLAKYPEYTELMKKAWMSEDMLKLRNTVRLVYSGF